MKKIADGFFVRTNVKGAHFQIDPMNKDLGMILEKRKNGKWFASEVDAFAFSKGIGNDEPKSFKAPKAKDEV